MFFLTLAEKGGHIQRILVQSYEAGFFLMRITFHQNLKKFKVLLMNFSQGFSLVDYH